MNLGVTENEVEGAVPTTGIENLSIDEKEEQLTLKEIVDKAKETPSFGERFSLEDYWEKVFKHKFNSGDASLSQYPEIEEKIKDTLESLVEQGKLTKNEDGTYALANEKDLEESKPTPEIPEEAPVEAPVESPEEISAVENQEDIPVVEDIVPEWKKGEEWKKFEEMRDDLARYDMPRQELGVITVGLELKRSEYRNYKEAIAEKIKETLRREGASEAEISDVINKELLDKEHNTYIENLRRYRSETLSDKTKESLRNFANTKLVKWYLGKNRYTKFAINAALFGTALGIGTFAMTGSAAVAMGAAGYRTIRGIGSLAGSTLGTFTGSKIKGLNLEEINQWEEDKINEIKQSQTSLESKTAEYEKIKKEAEKKRRGAVLKKAALTVGLGAGAGVAAGGILDAYYQGSGDVARFAAESQNVNKSGVMQDRIPRGRMEPTPVKPPMSNEFVGPKLPQEMEIKEPAVADKPFVGPKLPQEEIVNTATVEKIFENPENLKHIKVEGKVNSFWGVIKKGLEENEQFRGFTEAQKDNVISYFTNKGIGKEIGDPEKYGLTSDPDFGVKVETGKEIDLSKLLGDTEEVEKVLDGAAKKTLEEQQNILHKDAQIATYLQENPNVKLTNDTVAEILNTKPKAEILTEASIEESPISKTPTEVELVKSDIPETLENPIIVEPIKSDIPENLETNSKLGPIAEPLPPPEMIDSEAQIHKDIAIAKDRLAELENNRNNNLVRSFSSDSKSVLSGAELTEQVENAFRGEIDDIYGKKGFLGIGKMAGVDTPEWGKMAKLSANDVVEYHTSNSAKSELPEEIINELSKSNKHKALIKQVIGLMGQTNNTVKPFNNENIEQFIKRLGKFLMEHPPQAKLSNLK